MFIIYESDFNIWLAVEIVKKEIRVYSDANESLFRLWHRLLHVMLDILLIMSLLVMLIS